VRAVFSGTADSGRGIYGALYSVQVADSNFLDRQFRERRREDSGRRVSDVSISGIFRCFCRVPFSTLVDAAESRFGAFVGNRQKALHAFTADYIRMSITGFSLRQCGQLLLGSVGIGVVGQDDVGTRL
jgi:hypothetical protein